MAKNTYSYTSNTEKYVKCEIWSLKRNKCQKYVLVCLKQKKYEFGCELYMILLTELVCCKISEGSFVILLKIRRGVNGWFLYF